MSRSVLRVTTINLGLALLAALWSLTLGLLPASAADAVFAPGEPIVTGFSGVVEPASPPAGTDPLDLTFIDLDGKSVVIQKLEPDGPGAGQLIDAEDAFSAKASDVGQVFGVTIDDAPDSQGANAPNIYVAATSAFGLNIVVPGADGNPIRSKTGAADATFMPGQWGGAGGEEGHPGSIWKIDGMTGEVSLFTTIANTGAGLGNIVYDPASAQFFVSDLDTGLIYRLASDGTIVDTFDHGVTGRPTHGLDVIADDGSAVDITDPAFDTEDPTTWGFTQPERRVYGLAIHNGRLYYSVADGPQVWSVGIKSDGSFGTARWELDASGLTSFNEVTGIAFDPQGRMILAQRGPQVGSYDYSVFAEPGSSSVARYKREAPDDPATPSVWVETPDTYPIGLPDGGTSASGGVAVGYGFNTSTGDFTGACGATVWATGDGLRANAALDPPVEGPMQVSGLQGMAKTLVRPVDDPPLHSFFTDYDGNTDDSTANQAGHVGAVAIWQVCGGPSSPTPTPPDDEPPDYIPPPDYIQPDHYNLTLEKWSAPYFCFDGGANYWCNYTIRVENTGTVPYWGPIHVHDYLPTNPPGATMSFWPSPPWFCGPSGPGAYDCAMGPALLYPGDAVVLHETVKLPKPVPYCQLANVAGIVWPFFGHDEDPSDDFDGALAGIPSPVPGCVPPGGGSVSDLTLSKFTFPSNCLDAGVDYLCQYHVVVQNAGPGLYSGPITVKDTLGATTPATVFGPWTCGQVGPVLTCNINAPPVNASPGWSSGFIVQAHVKKPGGPPLCDLPNKAQITVPAGGSPNNVLSGNDFGTATTHIPAVACIPAGTHSDLQIKKTALGCSFGGINYYCKWDVTLKNVGTANYAGPYTWKDTSLGATYNTLTTNPTCTGTSVVTCTPVGPFFLAAGASTSVQFWTRYAPGATVCTANNNAAVVTPNPGSVQNPSGNDSSSASQPITVNPACAGLPALVITKTAKGCASDPSSPNWLCKWDIAVKNVGAVAQPAPIKVKDFSLKPTTMSGAACVPAGINTWECTWPTPLAAGATWSFHATSKVDPNGVTLLDCNVVNTAWITNPFSGDPGHWSQANQKVPQLIVNLGPGPAYVYCDPPSLKLAKTAGKVVPSGDGYNVTYTVTATSTGPDPYHGTVEVDELLPPGLSYVSSSWTCKPTSGNDMHCSSPYVDMNVGQSTSMTIVIHVSKTEAQRNKCAVTNTVNVAISADVLHSDKGVNYTASATAKLPAEACAKPPACPPNQAKPGGGCCDPGLVWNGKQCAPPKPICPRDSVGGGDNGACVCKDGTHGKPGQCVPDKPACPKDSVTDASGDCSCKDGTHGKPGRCVPDQVVPICPRDSTAAGDNCVCKDGTHGKPGRCVPDQVIPICPRDSTAVGDNCVCNEGTHGKPGRCVPDQVIPTCPEDSVVSGDSCVCKKGLTGVPGQCIPDVPVRPKCPRDSVVDDSGNCVCRKGTHGEPGQCQIDIVIIKPPVIKPPVITPPISLQCPADSHFDRKAKSCVCTAPLVGKPGACQAEVVLR